MWICFNNAFLSVVHKDCGPDELLVRARRPGDIERVFPNASVVESTDTDYRYRAVVSRDDVSAAVVNQVNSMKYSNFKNTVRDDALHSAYARVWGVMANLQPSAPYSGVRLRQAR